jgi:carboxylesterase type B
MFGQLTVICALVLIGSEANLFESSNVAETENGVVAGELRGNYYAFEGMRYAAPPVGENRFRPPQPYTEKWQDVQNFTQIRSACIQFTPLRSVVEGNEDCLFVNVYKPAQKTCGDYKFPVVVHIHGGALQFGDASFYGPNHIMNKGNFVYVSFNYRLGILGFLSTLSSVAPGNMGFKDQVMALKWVQRNIDAFDGDVDSITLTGFSGGAASVHLHYMSPLSRGLFHRGISHSSTALADWVLMKNPVEKAITVAEHVNCSSTDQQEMIDCMRTKPAFDLVSANTLFYEQIGRAYRHPIFTFTAVVEYDCDEAFISRTPRQYLKQRRIQRLPWLVTGTKNEGLFLTGDMYSDQTIAKINSNWDHYLAILLDFNSTDPETRSWLATEIKSEYFDNQPLSKENYEQLTKVRGIHETFNFNT